MAQRNCIKIADNVKINERFNMTTTDAQAIRDTYGDSVAIMMFTAFKFGYAQGVKATKAELKKGEANHV